MKTVTAAGVTLGAASVAALSAYLLYGKKGLSRRNGGVRGWMFRMRADVLDEIEQIKDLTQERYNEIVDRVSEKYQRLENVGNREISRLKDDLRQAWFDVKTEVGAR